MLPIEKVDNVQPICPHCKAEIKKVYFRELRGALGRRYIYFCSECRSCLGVTHRKGLWMG